jgi:hypothetical protein
MESDPARALDEVARSRARLADRLVTPWWYHPALGLMAGVLVATPAARSTAVTAAVLALYGVGVSLLVQAYRARTGVWVNGLRGGRASRWAVALGVVIAVAFLTGITLDKALDWRAAPLAAGVVTGLATVLLGRQFDESLRRELRQR